MFVVAALTLIGLGALLLKWCVFDVLAAAARHEPTVEFGIKGVFMAPTSIVCGVAALIASVTHKGEERRALFANPQTRKPTPLGYAFAALLLLLGGGLYFWMRSRLTAYGYDV